MLNLFVHQLDSVLIILFGLIVGSFINAYEYRLYHQQPIFLDRSRCTSCKKILKWIDLIPVLSALIRRLKCRWCTKPISIQYPIVEVATALLFVIAYHYSMLFPFLGWANIPLTLYIMGVFIFLTIYDLKYFLIPDRIILPAIAVVLIAHSVQAYSMQSAAFITHTLLAAVLFGGFFLLQLIITKGKGVGGGDIRLGLLIGALLGTLNGGLAIALAYLIAVVVLAIPLLISSKVTLKTAVPFGPFLILGTIITIFYADLILDLVMRFILI